MLKCKPCPICGNKRMTKYIVITRRWYQKKRYVECDYCHFCSKSAYTKRGAIRLWNKSTNVVCIKAKDGEADAD